jgi:26S proteasome non-ATPase regulatory subunit 9
MDDIHTPSVASGPMSGSYANGISKDDMNLDQLMGEKDRLESELKALSAVLDSVCRHKKFIPRDLG